MKVTIDAPSLVELKSKAKIVAQDVFNKPVPLGKTVLTTALVIGVAQVIIFRKYKVSIVLTKT